MKPLGEEPETAIELCLANRVSRSGRLEQLQLNNAGRNKKKPDRRRGLFLTSPFYRTYEAQPVRGSGTGAQIRVACLHGRGEKEADRDGPCWGRLFHRFNRLDCFSPNPAAAIELTGFTRPIILPTRLRGPSNA